MSGSERKILRLEYIKAVVDDLYYAHSTPNIYNKFSQLQCVKQRMDCLKDITIKRSALLEYTVQELLCGLIETNLCQQRLALGIQHQAFDRLKTYKQASIAIQQDAKSQVRHLIGWSLLHHVYLHPELGVSQEHFADIANINERSARRYKHLVFHILLQDIIQLEINLVSTVS